jgi:hypothetical protein
MNGRHSIAHCSRRKLLVARRVKVIVADDQASNALRGYFRENPIKINSEGRGQGFESLRARQFSNILGNVRFTPKRRFIGTISMTAPGHRRAPAPVLSGDRKAHASYSAETSFPV